MYSKVFTLVDGSMPVPVRVSLVKFSGSQNQKDKTVGASLLEGKREVGLIFVESEYVIYIFPLTISYIYEILYENYI